MKPPQAFEGLGFPHTEIRVSLELFRISAVSGILLLELTSNNVGLYMAEHLSIRFLSTFRISNESEYAHWRMACLFRRLICLFFFGT